MHSLKLTAKAPEKGCLEYDRFLLGPGLFSGAMLVSGSVTYPLSLGKYRFNILHTLHGLENATGLDKNETT